MATSEKSATKNGGNFAKNANLSAQDFPAKVSPSPASERDFWTKFAARCSSRLPARLNRFNHGFYCLKTSKAYCFTTAGELSRKSSPHWMNWGMTRSGKCLTAKILASHSTANVCILSDILEEKAEEKYFLSAERSAKLIWKNERIGIVPYKSGKLPQRRKVVRENGISPTLLASGGYEPQMVAIKNNSPHKPFIFAKNGDNISLQANARGSVRKGYSGTITTASDAVLDGN